MNILTSESDSLLREGGRVRFSTRPDQETLRKAEEKNSETDQRGFSSIKEIPVGLSQSHPENDGKASLRHHEETEFLREICADDDCLQNQLSVTR
jgi:hypothetical protein